MKNLNEYIKEGLFDDVDKLEGKNGLENALKVLKNEMKEWIKENISKSNGRIKLNHDKTLNKFIASYQGNTVNIHADIPEHLLLDFDVKWLFVEASVKDLLSRFTNLNVENSMFIKKDTTLGEPLNPCKIHTIHIENDILEKSNIIDPKMLQFDHVWLDCRNPVEADLSMFKKHKGIEVTIQVPTGSKINLDGLDINEMSIRQPYSSNYSKVQISGDFKVNKFDCEWVYIDYKGSIDIKSISIDRSNSTLPHIKKLDSLTSNYYLEETQINRLIDGDLKVGEYIEYYSGKEISKDEYITKALWDLTSAIYNKKCNTTWTDRKFVYTSMYINDAVEKWAENNKQYRIEKSEVAVRWMFIDKKTNRLIGFYQGAPTTNTGLYTDDTDLMNEFMKLNK